jgi:ATP-dependent DNA ligase
MESIFLELANTSSRLEKEAILKKHHANETLKRVLFLALDPYTQFYIRKIPGYSPNLTERFATPLAGGLDNLDKIINRDVTGNAAIQHLKNILESVLADDAKVIERIIEKDLKCGVSEATVNKIWPNLIPTYPVMLASGFDEKIMNKMTYPAYVQLKLDGMRFNAIVQNNKVDFRSRNGKSIDLLGNLEQEFLSLAGELPVVFDGELIVREKNGSIMNRQKGNGILNKAVKGTISDKEATMVEAVIWDIIPLEHFKLGESNLSYESRFEILQNLEMPERVSLIENIEVASEDEAHHLFEEYFSKGEEGIILKDITKGWEDKRVKHQVKFKGELECDLLCVDWQEGTGKNVGKLGALVLESSDKLVKVNVGSGFTDEQRDKYTMNNTVGKIVAVKYNAKIQDKKTGEFSLFLPVFIELREDKDVADSLSSIK